MEVFRITVLSLLLWMAYVPYAVTAGNRIYAAVGENLTLACPSWGKDPSVTRSWNRGSYDANNKPPDDKLIYKAGGGKEKKGNMFRTDMTFDEKTFAMTLTVQNDPSDNDNFTCMTENFDSSTFDVHEVLIFLQPVVTITRDIQPEEGINITVTCTVERLYPNITGNQFTMRWDNQAPNEPEFSGIKNDDGSMKYTLEKTKNLTRDDNGAMVSCTVTPDKNFGESVTESLALNFTMGITTPPASGGSKVGATVGGVINGLAAVAIVVAISDYGIM